MAIIPSKTWVWISSSTSNKQKRSFITQAQNNPPSIVDKIGGTWYAVEGSSTPDLKSIEIRGNYIILNNISYKIVSKYKARF